MRSRGRLECEESGRSASVVPRKRRRSNLKTMRTGATRVWRSLLWTSFRAMERGGRPSLGSSIRRCEFLFFLKAVGVSPFCSAHFKLSGESVQPRSRRPGRTGSARGTHTRTFTCTLGRICQAHASFFVPTILGSREGLRTATMHTPHQRARGTGECTVQPSCHDSCTLWPCRCVLALAKLGLIRSPITCLRPRLLRLGLRTAIHLPLH